MLSQVRFKINCAQNSSSVFLQPRGDGHSMDLLFTVRLIKNREFNSEFLEG